VAAYKIQHGHSAVVRKISFLLPLTYSLYGQFLPTFFKRVDPSGSRPQDDNKSESNSSIARTHHTLTVAFCHFAANE